MANNRRSRGDRRDPKGFKIKHILPAEGERRTQILIQDEDVDIDRRNKKHRNLESKTYNPKPVSKSNPKLPMYDPNRTENFSLSDESRDIELRERLRRSYATHMQNTRGNMQAVNAIRFNKISQAPQYQASQGSIAKKVRGKSLILGAGLALANAIFAAKAAYGKAEEKAKPRARGVGEMSDYGKAAMAEIRMNARDSNKVRHSGSGSFYQRVKAVAGNPGDYTTSPGGNIKNSKKKK